MRNNKNLIIRSTKTSLKFSNSSKKQSLSSFIDEYHRICQLFIDALWPSATADGGIPSLLPKEMTEPVKSQTWLSARAVQSSAKQASGIVRGTVQKHKQRLWKLKELQKQRKDAKHLQRKISKTRLSKPTLEHICPELDERFVEIQEANCSKEFDLWVKFGSLGNNLNFIVPLKKTIHFNSLLSNGFQLKKGIRLSKNSITFNLEKEKPEIQEPQNQEEILGIDVGITNCWTASNGSLSKEDKDGHNLQTIQQRLSRRKPGSKGFRRAQAHRRSYINWSINQLSLQGIQQINIEDIKDLRRGKTSSRFMSSWAYGDIFDKLERLCEEAGVLLRKIDPTYTSQRCFGCGWTRKRNRKGKRFKCSACGFTADADLNASRNISLPLPPMGQSRRKQLNRTGFYWNVSGQEHMVSGVQKRNIFP